MTPGGGWRQAQRHVKQIRVSQSRASPSVGGLHQAPGTTGSGYPASCPPIKGSLNPVMCGSGRISSSFWPAVILGSSMVRNVTVPGAKIMPYPGAQVNYITKLLPNVLRQDMDIDSIVVHVGFKDITKGSSEQLILDIKELIFSAKH